MHFDFTGKRIAVVGMARSGMAAAEVLSTRGADVSVYDSKPESELAQPLEFLRDRRIAAFPGVNFVGDADLLVTSPGVPVSSPVLIDAAARSIPIWSEIEAAYRISGAPILAITGTNGKTTTTALLGAIMRRAGIKTFLAGNIAAGPISMALIRAADLADSGDVIVAEISSFQLEWIQQFRPHVAALLNISEDHSDRQTWDEYISAKWRIFENQSDGDTAVLRSDVLDMRGLPVPRGNIVCFDRLERPDWLADIRLPGEHNRENVMAALAMANAFGIPDDVSRNAALEFEGVVHRLEYVATIRDVRWFNNSMCTNNDAFARSLSAIEGPKVVIAGGVYKGGDLKPFADAASDKSVRALVCFGQSGRVLCEAAGAAGAGAAEVVENLAQAVDRAAVLARPHDSVLLSPACASFDQFKNFEDRGNQFKEMVRELAESDEIQQGTRLYTR